MSMLNTESLEIYDEHPYGDEPFANTHPENLAGIGTLFGLSPTNPRKCRFLELGAAQGGNLIGIAYSLPESTFLGIDLSLRQIQTGTQTINQIGLPNVNLEHVNILDIKWDFGSYDYIIAHGILSWVPSEVKEKMFELCSKLLTPNGICYFSYNTYPGWKTRDIFREMMFFEAENYESSEELAKKSRNAVQHMNALLARNQSPLSTHLRQELQFYIGRPDWYYLHDFVAENNNPFYITDICKKAQSYDLQYFADTELSSCTLVGLSKEDQLILRQFKTNRVKFEQYLDFARLRSFRRSLFCRADKTITFENQLDNVLKLCVASNLSVSTSNSPHEYIFAHSDGGMLKIRDETTAQALTKIAESWPKAISVTELTKGLNSSDTKKIQETILQGIYANIVQVRTNEGPMASKTSTMPCSSLLAREQARNSDVVTSLLNHPVILDKLDKKVLLTLDGKTSMDQCYYKVFNTTEKSDHGNLAFKASLEKLKKNALLLDS